MEIEIVRDDEYTLQFRIDHYFSKEIEYSVTHTYSFDNIILCYSNFESVAGSFISYLPSERNYSESFLDTGIITKSTECMFY